MILWHCFGLRSASRYQSDFIGNKVLEESIGHVEHGSELDAWWATTEIPLIKTHEHHIDDNRPAIYVVRNGCAACVSLWEFYGKTVTLEDIISGEHFFGSWSAHLNAWKPWERPGTLLLSYEEMVANLPSVLERLSQFLGVNIRSDKIPNRDSIASMDGRWVRMKGDWRTVMNDAQLTLFEHVNGVMMRQLRYITDRTHMYA